MLSLLLACAASQPADSGAADAALVDPAAWVLDLDAADPLADHRPETVACSTASIDEEYGGVEIDTTACTYAQLQQPLRSALEAGEPLRVIAWHQALAALEPAEAHLALLVDDVVVWEQHVAIPGDAQAWDTTFDSPLSAEAGSRVLLHLHNHGANTWTLADFARAEPTEPR